MRLFVKRLAEHSSTVTLTYPWQRERTPYRVLVAEILLVKTSATKVAEIYDDLLESYTEPCSLADADLTKLAGALYSLGLLGRAERLRSAARKVCHRFGGLVPGDEASLLTLEGVGLYTARAILCFGFGERVPIVDWGIARLFDRYFGNVVTRHSEPYRDPAVWELASAYVRDYPGSPAEANYTLLDAARTICVARSPRCEICPLRETCHYATERGL